MNGTKRNFRTFTPPLLMAVILLALALFGLSACGQTTAPEAPRAEIIPPSQPAGDGLPEIALEDLPREARRTLDLIRTGGPFPYSRDGTVFGNRERLLPAKERGYYREYTVVTPGSRDRGARRIVAGAGGERYYTDDHYDSFRRIRE
ncbi:MAG: ribonuclease N1 [Acidobacteria bacterium]|nr:ribonuclease N1 [Acidobacteriota bacterium]